MLLFLLQLACREPTVGHGVEASIGPFLQLPDGSFAARHPGGGSTAVFGPQGARLSGVRVETAAWGRRGRMAPWSGAGLAVSGCGEPADPARCRVVSGAPGVEEWWRPVDGGWEQGWTLDTPPPGDPGDPLRMEVAVAGSRVEGGELTVRDGEGRTWRVGRFAAWDGRGRSLPVEVAVGDGRFVVEVDDSAAAYPVVIDPVYLGRADVLPNLPRPDQFGWELDGGGDVNGDGFADVLVGGGGGLYSPVWVYHGSAGGVLPTPVSELLDVGAHLEARRFGTTVVNLGDLDADGYDDVAASDSAGGFYVFRGGPAGVDPLPALFQPPDPGDLLGSKIARAGDVDGDGRADLIMNTRGSAVVYYGDPVLLSRRDELAVQTISSDTKVAGAGDVNGDGYDDVLYSDEYERGQTGRVWLFYGSPAGIVPVPAATWAGSGPSAYFGRGLAGVGDVNGDGLDDIAVGEPGWNQDTGRVHLVLGSTGTPRAVYLHGDRPGDRFGTVVDGVGDTDGDGLDDLLVYSPVGWWQSGHSSVKVYRGSTTLPLDPPTVISGNSAFDRIWNAAGVGDVDGDGLADVAVTQNTGDVYIHHGCQADADRDGFCDVDDLCVGVGWTDGDADGSCDGEDLCEGDDLSGDSDGDGRCDDTDLRLAVTPLAPQQPFTATVQGALPGQLVYLLRSTDLGRGFIVGVGTSGLRSPDIMATAPADASGEVVFSFVAPAVLPQRVYLQVGVRRLPTQAPQWTEVIRVR
jgi:hypothetical protein